MASKAEKEIPAVLMSFSHQLECIITHWYQYFELLDSESIEEVEPVPKPSKRRGANDTNLKDGKGSKVSHLTFVCSFVDWHVVIMRRERLTCKLRLSPHLTSGSCCMSYVTDYRYLGLRPKKQPFQFLLANQPPLIDLNLNPVQP